MTSTMATITLTNHSNGETIKLLSGYAAAVRIFDATKRDILDWVVERSENRMGWGEIMFMLQTGSDYSLREIWDKFLGNPSWFLGDDKSYAVAVRDTWVKIINPDTQAKIKAEKELQARQAKDEPKSNKPKTPPKKTRSTTPTS